MNNLLQLAQAILQQAMQRGNPMAKNVFEMMQKGDRKGTEEMARNMLKERGLDPDEVYKQFRSMIGQ